ncbi:MAG: c-type cytochrome [Verrucomicrobia bacterium]|nr:c-type cytochrome [Verrucomicrobiota bacterium]
MRSVLVLLLAPGLLWADPAAREKAVRELFQARCYDCHHPDTSDEPPYLHGQVNLEELLDGDLVRKGDPGASALFHRVTLAPEDRKRMPRSRGASGDGEYREPLTAAEKKVLEEWISGLGEAVPSGGVTVPVEKLAAAVAKVPEAGEEGGLPLDRPLEEQVHWIFDEHCAKCHGSGPGAKNPELTGVTNLALLLADSAHVTAGRPESSLLLQVVQLAEGDAERMPKSKGKPGEPGYRRPLNEREIAALAAWIAAAKGESKARVAVRNEVVISKIAEDVRAAPPEAQPFLRYFTFTNLHNATEAGGQPTVDDATLDSHRAGLGKLLNSLSSSAAITRPVFVDPERTIARVDLRDYGWTATEWERVIRFYPYGITGIDKQKERLIEKATGCPMAYVRADWFTFAAAQAPLYVDLLERVFGVPAGGPEGTLERWEKRLGVNRIGNLQKGEAIRAGFQYSGVSEANRLIERHGLGKHPGAYWISYDFTPLGPKPTQQLTRAPLGPVDAQLTANREHAFEHDGGEVIFHLPNGLQGYLLTTATGKRLDRAPIEIVQDDQRADNQILNGVSCIGCHDQGMKAPPSQGKSVEKIRDEVRPVVEASGILDFKGKQLLGAMYVAPEELRSVMKEDMARFQKAQEAVVGGLAGAAEPVLALYNDFRSSLNATKLAAEFGLGYDELLQLMKEEAASSEGLSVLRHSLELKLPLRREDVLRDYVGVVRALGFSLLPFEPLAYEDFGGAAYAKLIRESADFRQAFGAQFVADLDKGKAAFDVPEKPADPDRAALARNSGLLSGGGSLSVSIQPKLQVGQRAVLSIDATADVYLRVVHLSSDEFVTELFPGASGQSGFLPEKDTKELSWETTAPGGTEHVMVYASPKPIKNTASRGARVAGGFKVMRKDQFFSPRGIPIAIQASTKSSTDPAPASIDEVRIGYLLSMP